MPKLSNLERFVKSCDLPTVRSGHPQLWPLSPLPPCSLLAGRGPLGLWSERSGSLATRRRRPSRRSRRPWEGMRRGGRGRRGHGGSGGVSHPPLALRFPEASSLGSNQQSDGRRGRRPPEGVREKTEERHYPVRSMCMWPTRRVKIFLREFRENFRYVRRSRKFRFGFDSATDGTIALINISTGLPAFMLVYCRSNFSFSDVFPLDLGNS